MNTAIMIVSVVCATILAIDIVSEVSKLIRIKMKWKYGRMVEKDADKGKVSE